jgi:hypothetical protein
VTASPTRETRALPESEFARANNGNGVLSSWRAPVRNAMRIPSGSSQLRKTA